DIPGQGDPAYLTTVINNSINQKPIDPEQYRKYFSISAWVWRKSTEKSLHNMFGQNGNLQLSPPVEGSFTKGQLKPLTHFFNCHGAPRDPGYYGQKGKSFPQAIHAGVLDKNIAPGTVAAAECCYGAELYDPSRLGIEELSIANTYLANNALGFLGSSTIAYGPSDDQGLADLITQYFINEVISGASLGRALLEARQQFLTDSGPQLDPYELKTLAQFYLLGDPSVQPALSESDTMAGTLAKSSIDNNRMRLFSKGMGLKKTITPAKKVSRAVKTSDEKKLKEILKETDFTEVQTEHVYEVKPNVAGIRGMQKKLMGENIRYRTFIKPGAKSKVCDITVLVVKENKEKLLGWRMYVSK
ncbi:MAG: hypothetical protein ICV65_17375, partial [Flavisolibacter sp.]|nr:hypothetical protein [Flavisolibacter sp.]